MILVPPNLSDLGFANFQGPLRGLWREYQAEAVGRIINSTKKFVLVQAPTGAGKSPIAVAAAALIDPKVVRRKVQKNGDVTELIPQSSILSTTKQLTWQYLGDFSDQAIELKGRSNFDCLVEPVTAAEAPCTIHGSHSCPSRGSCPYFTTLAEAEHMPLGINNYANYLTNANYSQRFHNQTALFLDECHLLDDQLMGFISQGVSLDTCGKFDIIPPTSSVARGMTIPFREWQAWAATWYPELDKQVARLKEVLRAQAEPDMGLRRQWQQGKTLLATLSYLRGAEGAWITTNSGDYGWEFKPVWIGQYADNLLYQYGGKIVLMSATILDPVTFAKTVGINPLEMEFVDVPSTFPAGARPVYYNPQMVVKGGMGDGELQPLLDSIYRTCRDHEGEKGLIHTVSFPLAQAIVRQAPDDIKYRLMGHTSKDRLRVYEEFRLADEDRILISPSMKEGVSLEDDLCRFIVVCKVPFPYLGDPQVKARMASPMGRDWYAWKAMCDLMQMTGRGMRSMTDRCAVYILDESFGRLFRQMARYVPKYWRDDIVDVKGRLVG